MSLRASLPALALLLAGASSVLQSRMGAAPQDHQAGSPALSDQELLAPPTSGWLKNGGNLFNQNYSPLTQINRQNVVNLKAVWRTHLDGSGLNARYSGEAQPIVHAGVIYMVTGADDVFAIRVKTGERLWTRHANLPNAITTVCCGWTSRGVALGDGKVFVGQLDGQLVACVLVDALMPVGTSTCGKPTSSTKLNSPLEPTSWRANECERLVDGACVA